MFFDRASCRRFASYSLRNASRILDRLSNRNREGVSFIVFSKDRAAQLDLLLRSAEKHIEISHEFHVIYTSSNHQEDQNYARVNQLFSQHRWVKQVQGKGLKRLVLQCLCRSRYAMVAFVVDDMIFFSRFSLGSWIKTVFEYEGTFSLRLGKNIKRSFMLGRQQAQPRLRALDGYLLNWEMVFDVATSSDWSYALSVDGDIMRHTEAFLVALLTSFRTPNELESHGQRIKRYFSAYRSCFEESVACNIPDNIVQNTFRNASLNGSGKVLSDGYALGMRISLEDIEARLPGDSVHMEIPYSLESRDC